MSKKIHKINQLTHTDSFMQINFLRGFKYIDKAGEIINSFFTEQKEPPYQMTQRELIIKENEGSSETYRIAVNNVWSHNSNPQNFGNLEQIFQKKYQEILTILDVNEVVRIGWRNYFVYEFNNADEKNSILSKLTPIADSEFLNLVFDKKINGIKCKFLIKGAEKNNEERTPAIIIDVDCSNNFENNPIEIGDIFTHLGKIREALLSESMLNVVNDILNLDGGKQEKQ